MKKDSDVLLGEMLDAVAAVMDYVQGLDRDAFLKDARTQDAVCMRLLTLGEAAGALLRHFPDFENNSPDIPWRAMAGLRNHIAHDYFGLDKEMVWQTAAVDMPILAGQLRRLTHEPPAPTPETSA
jgi:uncharacterized protein with HEPN domain